MSAYRFCLALVAALALAAPAAAVESPDNLNRFVFPGSDLSSRDEVFVLYADNCGRPHPDATRPAEISTQGNLVRVDLFLVEPEEQFCLAVVLPDRLHTVALGRLPLGDHTVQRRLWVRAFDGVDYRLESDAALTVRVGDGPHASASGLWFSPAMPGNGLVLNLLPAEPGGAAMAVVFLATHDANGQPEWLSGAGEFIDAVLRVPLRRASTPPSAPADGMAEFRYLGCGAAEFSVSGITLAFPSGIESVRQMTSTKGVETCRPPALRPPSLD